MVFGRFYIKNYHAKNNSYFPLKVKGHTGEKYFYTCTETAFRASVSHEICAKSKSFHPVA